MCGLLSSSNSFFIQAGKAGKFESNVNKTRPTFLHMKIQHTYSAAVEERSYKSVHWHMVDLWLDDYNVLKVSFDPFANVVFICLQFVLFCICMGRYAEAADSQLSVLLNKMTDVVGLFWGNTTNLCIESNQYFFSHFHFPHISPHVSLQVLNQIN